MVTNHTNLLIYLKEINSTELENVTDFLYIGEANVTHTFLETARELQVECLYHNLDDISQNKSESDFSCCFVANVFASEDGVKNKAILKQETIYNLREEKCILN